MVQLGKNFISYCVGVSLYQGLRSWGLQSKRREFDRKIWSGIEIGDCLVLSSVRLWLSMGLLWLLSCKEKLTTIPIRPKIRPCSAATLSSGQVSQSASPIFSVGTYVYYRIESA